MDIQDQAPEAVAEEPVVDAPDAPASDAAAEPVAAQPVAAEPVAETPAPAAEEPAVEEAAPIEEAVAEDLAPEHVVDGLIDGDTLIAMSHPNGGSSDAYEANDKGEILVPATDVGLMASHGFVVVEAE